MKLKLRRSVFIALLATLAVAPPAGAQCISETGSSILLEWNASGYFFEAPNAPSWHNSPVGNTLTNMLAVSLFCSPLNTLDPDNPALEYTMVWLDLVSRGTTSVPNGTNGRIYTTTYTGGSFALYEGPVDARLYTPTTLPPLSVALSAYADGTVLLNGPIESLALVVVQRNNGSLSASFHGTYSITGGTLRNQVCGAGDGTAIMDGDWIPATSFTTLPYYGRNTGRVYFAGCPTPTDNTTWGRIKTLYR